MFELQASLRRWRTWIPLLFLVLAGAAILFSNYGAGSLMRWDEGLYGQFARNALTHDSYLLPLDTAGHYAKEPFSKPPLSFLAVALSFKIFGASLEALRLPFTLATFGIALVCWAWGNDLRRQLGLSRWLGFYWGFFFLLSEAAMKWGRYAIIEDLFVFFLILALWLHSRAASRSRWWALATGVALSLAFLTKQLAFGLAVAPIAAMELMLLRRQGFVRVALRCLLWAVPPIASAVGWMLLAYQREGAQFSNMLWNFALVERFKGYTGTLHFNSFNRMAGLLDKTVHPFAWLLGAVGLVLFLVHARRQKVRFAPEHWSLLLFFGTCVLMLENASKSLLPWYSLSYLPPLILGIAWLVTQAYRVGRLYWRRPRALVPGLWVVYATLGGWILLSAVETLLGTWLSRLNLVLLLCGAVVLVMVVLRPVVLRPSWLPGALLAASTIVLFGAHFRHREYRISPRSVEPLMAKLNEVNVTAPVVSKGVSRLARQNYEPVTLFGSAVRVGAPPWKALKSPSKSRKADAYIEKTIYPDELSLPAGLSVHRANGFTAWSGDLATNPVSKASLEQLLATGPLSFEAEEMGSDRLASLADDSRASGGKARRYKPWFSSVSSDHRISHAKTLRLPAGKYVAVAYLRWECGAQRNGRVGAILVAGKRKEISCRKAGDLKAYRPFSKNFTLKKSQRVPLEVVFRRGRGQLWHDRTQIFRRNVWEAKGG